ncbi:hypothetical protein [Glutamicibacter ardleyensis]|uniref:hypothetical protein n=1 Tax=Glutamicibacter ardleyensis TaxID=225894 RepID=UPI003FD1F08B
MIAGTVLEQVHAVCVASVREREQLISDFIGDRVSEKAITGITERFRRSNRVDRSHFEDLRQVIVTEVWLFLRDLSSGEANLAELRNFWGMLYHRSFNAVQQYVVHEVHHFGGMSAQIRTHQEFSRFIAKQRAEGVTAEDAVLIEQFNHGRSGSALMTAGKARQGLPSVTLADGSEQEHVSRETSCPDDDFLLHPHEGKKAVRLIVESLKANAKDPETVEYAEFWLGGFYRGDGEVMPTTHIAEAMGISRHRARTLQRRVRNEAQQIMKTMLGITADEV